MSIKWGTRERARNQMLSKKSAEAAQQGHRFAGLDRICVYKYARQTRSNYVFNFEINYHSFGCCLMVLSCASVLAPKWMCFGCSIVAHSPKPQLIDQLTDALNAPKRPNWPSDHTLYLLIFRNWILFEFRFCCFFHLCQTNAMRIILPSHLNSLRHI